MRQVPTTTVPMAGKLLGLSRNKAYEAASRGEIPTLRFKAHRCANSPPASHARPRTRFAYRAAHRKDCLKWIRATVIPCSNIFGDGEAA